MYLDDIVHKYWLLPANSKFYRYLDAFKDLKVLDWNISDKNGRCVNLEIGDIVFLYGSQEKRLAIKCEVIKIAILGKDSIEDSRYGGFDKKDRIFARLKFIKNILDDRVSMKDLAKMGVKGNIQSARKLSGEIVEKIESGINMESNQQNTSTTSLLNTKKQIILYGPAGTGKTYNTKSIIEAHSGQDYERLKSNGRVEFVTFHQSFAYEDFIEGIKPNLNENIESDISYKVEKGIFKELCEYAEDNFNKSRLEGKDLKSEENYERLVDDFGQFVKEQAIEDNIIVLNNKAVIEDVDISENGTVKNFSVGGSVTSKQKLTRSIISRDVESFIKGSIKTYSDVKPSRDSERGYHGNAIYYFYLYEKIKAYYDGHKPEYQKTVTKVEEKNYYLIIDEINRGNISKIFGELITLLEASKRLGEDDELTTTLPYSKEEFGIPPNLYIIGTMNTSDKSIAHLDIALRRRFSFVEMLPSYDENIIENEVCRTLLKNLNQRIEILLDKDHLIGHSFFCGISGDESDLDSKILTIMQNEIVPLLEEYFYGDYEKIQLVLAGIGYKLEENEIPGELKQYSSKEKLYGKLLKIGE